MEKRVVVTSQAPAPIGPYSQAIEAGDFIFCSGQIPLDPKTGLLVEGDITVQSKRILDNLEGVLRAAGSSLDQCVKLTVFMTDLKNFEALNQVLAGRFLNGVPPARAVVQVSALPKGASIEMDVIALKSEKRREP